ncbi:hypothetical protein ACJQWK_09791 [Exserohilum turcicum]
MPPQRQWVPPCSREMAWDGMAIAMGRPWHQRPWDTTGDSFSLGRLSLSLPLPPSPSLSPAACLPPRSAPDTSSMVARDDALSDGIYTGTETARPFILLAATGTNAERTKGQSARHIWHCVGALRN